MKTFARFRIHFLGLIFIITFFKVYFFPKDLLKEQPFTHFSDLLSLTLARTLKVTAVQQSPKFVVIMFALWA